MRITSFQQVILIATLGVYTVKCDLPSHPFNPELYEKNCEGLTTRIEEFSRNFYSTKFHLCVNLGSKCMTDAECQEINKKEERCPFISQADSVLSRRLLAKCIEGVCRLSGMLQGETCSCLRGCRRELNSERLECISGKCISYCGKYGEIPRKDRPCCFPGPFVNGKCPPAEGGFGSRGCIINSDCSGGFKCCNGQCCDKCNSLSRECR